MWDTFILCTYVCYPVDTVAGIHETLEQEIYSYHTAY